ncbi:hypothetical protein K3495_g2933 [Podosphaera aphanis]|nr:hypothetical protein K3495_g2933 [Podosphaera aphanis]
MVRIPYFLGAAEGQDDKEAHRSAEQEKEHAMYNPRSSRQEEAAKKVREERPTENKRTDDVAAADRRIKVAATKKAALVSASEGENSHHQMQ